MSENQTSSTSTPSTPSVATGEKAKIPTAGGGFSLDEFNRAVDNEEVIDEPDEPEVEEGSGELLDTPEDDETESSKEEEKEDGDEEESSEEDSEEDDEEDLQEEVDLEELGKGLKKGVKAFTKDGKAVTLPPDLEIEQVIDGEVRKINLREHLNVVAGEETVKSRLGKISSFREQVEQRRQELEKVHGEFNNNLNTLVSLVKEGKPDLAICFLAEMNKMSPIQMKRKFLDIIVAEATKFEGKSEAEIDNYYLNLDRQWRERKEQKLREKSEKEQKASQFVRYVSQELQKESISPDEFNTSVSELRKNGELEGLSQEAALDRAIEHALLTKHTSMAQSAISLVDPKLVNNKKLFNLLLEHTHPNKFTVEEMADVLREYLGKATARIASSLSKKVQPQKVMAKSEKQNEAGKKQKVYRNQGDLARAFGL